MGLPGCPRLPLEGRLGALVWGRLAGTGSWGFPSADQTVFSARAVAGSQPHPVPSIPTHVTTPLTAGQQARPTGS